MEERDRQLERLRTLRDSGALTDAEFEAEVAKLAFPDGPPANPPINPPPPVEPPPHLPPASLAVTRRLNPLLIIAPIAAVAIAALVYFLVIGRGQQSVTVTANAQTNTPAPAPTAAPKAPSMRDRPEAEQLATAFRAVFGRDGPVPRADLGGDGGTERAARLLWTSFGPVLLTEASLPDGCHACTGYVGAYYLRDTGTGFEVAARYPEAAHGSGWGNAPDDWQVVENFTTYPALFYETGYTGQGYTTLGANLVELRPEGPSLSAFDRGADNSGAVGDEGEVTTYEGEIRNVIRNQSFDMVFTGTCEFTRRYVFRNNKFEPETELVPECAG